MNNPEELIARLLLRHSCVIVPGFGGFVAKRVSAVLDTEKGIMLPPRKSLLFNRQLLNNDGLLISELASEKSISFDQAAGEVEQMIQRWNRELLRGARVSVDQVGHLYFDQEKKLCFDQDRYFNLLLESFGLGKVHFILNETIDTRIIEPNPVTIKSEESLSLVERKTYSLWKVAAAACILPLAFYSFWIPTQTTVLQSGMFSMRDFNPFNKELPQKYLRQNGVVDSFRILDDEGFQQKDVYEFLAGISFPVNIKNAKRDAALANEDARSASKQYIVGVFSNRENVDLMIKKLSSVGLNAYVYDEPNGLQRVSAGGSEEETKLLEIRQKTSKIGVKGWVFRAK